MNSLLGLAALAIVALTTNGYAQEPKQAEITKASYMVTGLHCGPCATTVEGALKKTKGINSIKVDFKSKSAKIEFDENVISAQDVSRAMSNTPHMMGRGMQYGGMLLLSVANVKDQSIGNKAREALSKVEGVAKVTLYPQQEAIGIEFADKGKATTKQLIEALESAGLKGAQYGMANRTGGPGMNDGNGAMSDHAGMAMDKGSDAGTSAKGQRMGCGCCKRP